jgi:MFS family permease
MNTESVEKGPDFETTTPVAPLATQNDTDAPDQEYGQRPACFRNTFTECTFVLTTTVAVGMNSIFGGAVLCMTNAIGKDLGMSSSEVTWLWAGQNLAAGALVLLFGRVADLFGRRLILLLSLGTFTIFSLIAGFARSAIYLNIFVGLIGVACAAAVPGAIGKLGAVYPNPSYRKNRA